MTARSGRTVAFAWALALAFALPVRAVEPPPAAPVRIALVSDTHTTRGTKDDQPKYRGRLDRVIASVNAAAVAFVVVAGDLTQSGKPEEFEDFKQQIQGFRAPVLCVPGNHDVGAKRIAGKQAGPPPSRLATYAREIGRDCYVRQIAGIRVLAVNSQLFGAGSPEEARQWSLLETNLATPAAPPTVVLMHMPPFVESPDEPGGDYWNFESEPRQRFLELLRHGRVRAVLTGHLHREVVHHYDGVLLVSTLPVSFGLPAGSAPQGWTLVTVPPTGEPTVEIMRVTD